MDGVRSDIDNGDLGHRLVTTQVLRLKAFRLKAGLRTLQPIYLRSYARDHNEKGLGLSSLDSVNSRLQPSRLLSRGLPWYSRLSGLSGLSRLSGLFGLSRVFD
jgi:hypothetical protein